MNRILFTLTSAALLSSLLSGCGGGATTPQAPQVKTEFKQPAFVEGTVTEPLAQGQTVAWTDAQPVPASVNPISGKFSVTLLSAAEISKLKTSQLGLILTIVGNGGTCSGSLTVSDAAASVYQLSSLKLKQGNTKTTLNSGTMSLSSGADGVTQDVTLNLWLYSTAPVSWVGEKSCSSSKVEGGQTKTSTQKAVGAVYLKPGWNFVSVRFLVSASRTELEVRSADPVPTVWRVFAFDGIFETLLGGGTTEEVFH